MISPNSTKFVATVRGLLEHPVETEWLEFKQNNSNPSEIGEYISALANSAALADRPRAYIVWGVEDGTRRLLGTDFEPSALKRGNEDVENWLTRLLEPQVPFRFDVGEVDGVRIVVLEIAAASNRPVRFSGQEFVRVGNYKKRLSAHSEKERALWGRFSRTAFEDGIAEHGLNGEEALKLLSFASYFDLLGVPLPSNQEGILSALTTDDLVRRNDDGSWSVTNVGAVLFAKDLSRFTGLRRKAIRIVRYDGRSRLQTKSELVPSTGYAAGFEDLIRSVIAAIPTNEVIQQSLRTSVPMFPPLVVREVVANALIHQDFSISGACPMIEVFEDRAEVTNPGGPLMPSDRLLDHPPRSRNEKLAGLMRRFGICEERGSGIDKVVFQIELFQLPAPLFEVSGESLRVVLFGHRPLKDMDKADRIRACYLHACLRQVMREPMTNASLRQRFGIGERNSATASRILNEALSSKLVVVQDATVGTKSRRYLPFWAAPALRSGGVA